MVDSVSAPGGEAGAKAARKGLPSALAIEVLKETSPELAIKIAYDFARKLRVDGADESEYPELLRDNVEQSFAATPLLRYVRAGFKAGYFFQPFPWRRDIESESAG